MRTRSATSPLRRSRRGRPVRRCRVLVVTFAALLVSSVLWVPEAPAHSMRDEPFSGATVAAVVRQEAGAEATLETRRPEVEWSAAGLLRWVGVPDTRAVIAGDRVRTGPGAYARLLYSQGTLTELAAETSVVVQRLERVTDGSLVVSLVQSSGASLTRPATSGEDIARVEIETPAANSATNTATPRVRVAHDGTTVVANLPGGPAGLIAVRGKDPATTLVSVRANQQTRIRPGEAPSPPYALDEGTIRIRVCNHAPPCPAP